MLSWWMTSSKPFLDRGSLIVYGKAWAYWPKGVAHTRDRTRQLGNRSARNCSKRVASQSLPNRQWFGLVDRKSSCRHLRVSVSELRALRLTIPRPFPSFSGNFQRSPYVTEITSSVIDFVLESHSESELESVCSVLALGGGGT